MAKTAGKLTIILFVLIGSLGVGALFSYQVLEDDATISSAQNAPDVPVAPPTYARAESRNVVLASSTPEPSATATLLPPPTFEPPTATPAPSSVPSLTPTPTTYVSVSIPGLHGAESPTPTSTPGCEVRSDWTLTYTVQFDDTLTSIASLYGAWPEDLAEGNCIEDMDLISVGQVLHVPGDAQPVQSAVECVPWEVLTPFNGSLAAVPADGEVTFNWRGPQSQLSLIRIYRPDGTTYEQLVELRQNDTIDVGENLPAEGMYTWYVYPLGSDFRQVNCVEGGPWTFYKPAAPPTATPSPTQGIPTQAIATTMPAPTAVPVQPTAVPTEAPVTEPTQVPATEEPVAAPQETGPAEEQ